ncbi:hypothetical protein MRX96_038239 [Rhipicephalus microplus]
MPWQRRRSRRQGPTREKKIERLRRWDRLAPPVCPDDELHGGGPLTARSRLSTLARSAETIRRPPKWTLRECVKRTAAKTRTKLCEQLCSSVLAF